MPFDPVFPLLVGVIPFIVLVTALVLVVRFVRAHERVAAALESIANNQRRGGSS
jgi:hypothetical protein